MTRQPRGQTHGSPRHRRPRGRIRPRPDGCLALRQSLPRDPRLRGGRPEVRPSARRRARAGPGGGDHAAARRPRRHRGRRQRAGPCSPRAGRPRSLPAARQASRSVRPLHRRFGGLPRRDPAGRSGDAAGSGRRRRGPAARDARTGRELRGRSGQARRRPGAHPRPGDVPLRRGGHLASTMRSAGRPRDEARKSSPWWRNGPACGSPPTDTWRRRPASRGP